MPSQLVNRMRTLTCDIPALLAALEQRARTTGENTAHFVRRVLPRAISKPLHTLLQVSTSRALVQGVYGEAVSSSRLLCHGNFGLGTFDELDGEMVILDGVIYLVRSDGTVMQVAGDVGTPFARVLTFFADGELPLEDLKSMAELCLVCDKQRQSQNLFYAFRVDGLFESLQTRTMRRNCFGTASTSYPRHNALFRHGLPPPLGSPQPIQFPLTAGAYH